MAILGLAQLHEINQTEVKECNGGTKADMQECCSINNQCSLGQGDCDSHSECAGGLVCGRNNCGPEFLWSSADCCKEEGPDCNGGSKADKRECCSVDNPCFEGQGDCDKNYECAGDLVCGVNNCGEQFLWAEADCCTTRNTTLNCTGGAKADMVDCCTQKYPCAKGQGDCDIHSECEDGLQCGKNNCGPEFLWSSADCCTDEGPDCNGGSKADKRECCSDDNPCFHAHPRKKCEERQIEILHEKS